MATADERWQMPRRWPFDAVELTPAGLVVHRRQRLDQTLPWRMIRAIERPGAGVAVLRLGDGGSVQLPDRDPTDQAWMDRIAAKAVRSSARPPTRLEYDALGKAFIRRHGATHRCLTEAIRKSRGIWLIAAFPLALTLLAVRQGAVMALLFCLWFDVILLRIASVTTIRPGRLVVCDYRVQEQRVTIQGATGETWELPLAQLATVTRSRRGLSIPIGGRERLSVWPGRGAEALWTLVEAVTALQDGGFAGIDAQPPSAASISRITGHEGETADRGISLLGGDGDG